MAAFVYNHVYRKGEGLASDTSRHFISSIGAFLSHSPATAKSP